MLSLRTANRSKSGILDIELSRDPEFGIMDCVRIAEQELLQSTSTSMERHRKAFLFWNNTGFPDSEDWTGARF
jgi:hypothetical protein